MKTVQEIRTKLEYVQGDQIETIMECIADRVRVRSQDADAISGEYTRNIVHHACNDLRGYLGMEPHPQFTP